MTLYKWMLKENGNRVTAVQGTPWPVVRLESGY